MSWEYDKRRHALTIRGSAMENVLSLMLEGGVEEFGKEHYVCAAPWGQFADEIELIEAPDVVAVPPVSFAWLHKLVAVDISSAAIVGNSAFFNCINLKSMIAPRLQLIGNSAFANCYSLEGTNGSKVLELREAKHISAFAFNGCRSLSAITFKKKGSRLAEDGHIIAEAGSNLEFVGNGAFAGCTQLSRFSYGGRESNAVFGESVFHNAGINPTDNLDTLHS